MTDSVTLHTDGSCLRNPGPGGWAAVLQWRDEFRELSGAVADSTNNRMELQAANEGVNASKRPMAVDLHTDSKYVMQGVESWMPRCLTSTSSILGGGIFVAIQAGIHMCISP